MSFGALDDRVGLLRGSAGALPFARSFLPDRLPPRASARWLVPQPSNNTALANPSGARRIAVAVPSDYTASPAVVDGTPAVNRRRIGASVTTQTTRYMPTSKKPSASK